MSARKVTGYHLIRFITGTHRSHDRGPAFGKELITVVIVRVSVNAQTSVCMSVKYVQDVEAFWGDRLSNGLLPDF